MPRRRAGKGKPAGKPAPRKVNRRDDKVSRWNQPEDIPLDEEDQFHASRDKILLEGEQDPHSDDADEDEVFALEGLPSSEDDDIEAGDEDEGDGESRHVTEAPRKKKKATTIASKPQPPATSGGESDEEEEGWGGKKSAYYSSNAAIIESDDDEANEMEEQEARRLQAKLRESMMENDFGLDFLPEKSQEDIFLDEPNGPVEAPILPNPPQDKQAILRELQKTSPETLALAEEWDDIARSIMKMEKKLSSMEETDKDDSTLGLLHLLHQTQLTYASVLAFYLHLRASVKYAKQPELLKSHPILTRLLTLKQSLSTLEDLVFGLSDSETPSDEEELEKLIDGEDLDLGADELMALARRNGIDPDELEDLLREEGIPVALKKAKLKDTPRPKKRRKVVEENADESTAKFDLIEPEYIPSKAVPSQTNSAAAIATDSYGEPTSLDFADTLDKGARRKTLRFHTAKIEGASARRQGARNAIAGDDDIPYRERKREQVKEKPRSGLGEGGDDLDDRDPEIRKIANKREREAADEDGSSEESDDEGYYSLVKKQRQDKKQRKKAQYEAERLAEKPDFDDDVTAGQRSINRAIMANKGLTPHRSKSVRNPRVKKRMRFEKAKKKIASQKSVYKGGIGDTGRYDGERTGISRVVKSVKF
ncbi:hypothetical protein BD410DRAFT_787429 [Rickenella mellea]|uniref:Sas10 C-terminal domain-containing protein n=1 Tax=Rickenella mellea TaxID=50990 RepID=A0A4Y7Q899_9AGAM|nr:hypothetical protein BD410DRAFT_787429 [Rickenella mellea]